MFLKNIKFRLAGLFVFVLSMFIFINAPKALAETKTWDGSSDTNFSTGANWSGGTVPSNDDTLVFPFSAAPTDYSTVLTNDIVGLSVAGINFTGDTGSSPCTGKYYNFVNGSGGTLTLTGDIDASAMTGSCYMTISFELDMTVTTATFTVTQNPTSGTYIVIGDYATPYNLTLGTSNLSVPVGLSIYSDISGSGEIAAAGYLTLGGDNTNLTGAISVTNGGLYVNQATGLGSVGAGTTLGNETSIWFGLGTNITVAEPISVTGSMSSGYYRFWGYDYQCGDTFTIRLTGQITINGNESYYYNCLQTFQIDNLVSNGYSISNVPGSVGTLVIDGVSYEAPYYEHTYSDNLPSDSLYVTNKQRITLDGARGYTSVASGGILLGTGTVGELVVDSGGTVSPGHSPGCLNTGNLTEGGTYIAEIGGTTACTGYDQLNVTGTVDLTNGTLTTSLYNSYKPKVNENYIIINNDGSDAVTGTFTGLAEGITFAVNGYTFQITYKGGDGNDVVLTVKNVPAVPDAGFKMLSTNPLAILTISIMCAGGIMYASRRYNKGVANKA